MNRLRTLAIGLLLAAPASALGQATLDDFIKAIPRASSPNPKNLDDMIDWSAYNRAGWRAIGKGWYDTAEHEFLSAIQAARRPSMTDPRLLARSYADYAWAIQKQGRYAEAEPLAKWVLATREAYLEPGANPVAQSLNQLATLYYEVGRFAEAEPLLRRAVAMQAKAPRANGQEHARTHTLLGLLMVAQRRFAEAEPPFLKAMSLREKTLGFFHPETGDAVNNLAWVYHEQGKNDEANPLFERALKIFETSRGPSHPSVAHVLDGLARIHDSRDQFEEAEAKYLRAIRIWEATSEPGFPAATAVLKRYADMLARKGRAAESEKVRGRIVPGRTKLSDGQADGRFRLPESSPGTEPVRRGSSAPRLPG